MRSEVCFRHIVLLLHLGLFLVLMFSNNRVVFAPYFEHFMMDLLLRLWRVATTVFPMGVLSDGSSMIGGRNMYVRIGGAGYIGYFRLGE